MPGGRGLRKQGKDSTLLKCAFLKHYRGGYLPKLVFGIASAVAAADAKAAACRGRWPDGGIAESNGHGEHYDKNGKPNFLPDTRGGPGRSFVQTAEADP